MLFSFFVSHFKFSHSGNIFVSFYDSFFVFVDFHLTCRSNIALRCVFVVTACASIALLSKDENLSVKTTARDRRPLHAKWAAAIAKFQGGMIKLSKFAVCKFIISYNC